MEPRFEDLVKKHHELIEKDDMYIFAIFNKNQQHIGMIDIVIIRRGNFQWADCGYFIHNQHWRKGYTYEVLTKILHIADKALRFHRLETHVNLDNQTSIKVLEKTGFEFECTRKNFIYEFDQ
ncbi:GNAT family N-acetyltransferase [Staphylococcus delphini]|uniref:GNAT family N-acetyltransferase n=1 Tax=Staphylococcus delphini TaxID=53344 RepID=UPI0030B8950F